LVVCVLGVGSRRVVVTAEELFALAFVVAVPLVLLCVQELGFALVLLVAWMVFAHGRLLSSSADLTARERQHGRVGVRVVEGVHGSSRRDLDVKALACCHIADGELHAVDLGVPDEEDFVRSTEPLG
jgi:hypothetical protein